MEAKEILQEIIPVIRGMDGYTSGPAGSAIIEYKAAISPDAAREKLAEEQMKVYGAFVKDIKGKEPEKISVMLKQ